MNRWQAIVAIVKSFNERGATTLAFAALCVCITVPVGGLALVALAFDWGDAVANREKPPPTPIIAQHEGPKLRPPNAAVPLGGKADPAARGATNR